MPQEAIPILITRPELLRKIKRKQYRKMLLPMVTIFLIIVISAIVSDYKFFFLPLVVLAMIWYQLRASNFRLKQKIAVPPAGVFLSPLEGKVRSVSRTDSETYIALKKSFFDVVEIRCPATPYTVDKDNLLSVEHPLGTIRCKFQSAHITWFEVEKPQPGEVIGIMPGSGSCLISAALGVETEIADGQMLLAGETPLFKL